MADNDGKMGLPAVSTTEVVRILTDIYTGAIRKGTALKSLPTPFLWGPPGCGKSAAMYEIGENIERATGKKINVIDIRLALYSPVDLRGVPFADKDARRTVWLKPAVFDMNESDDMIHLLFLDELSAAPQSVQVAAYQLTLDRKVGEHILPDNCIVVCAGNRTTDQSVSFKMPKELANRLLHFELVPDFNSWKVWAEENEIDERVVRFLSFDQKMLQAEPQTTEVAFPTARSWTFVSDLLKTTGARPADIIQAISGCVGYTTAVEFVKWCATYDDLPIIARICSGQEDIYPNENDVLFTLTENLVDTVRNNADLKAIEIQNVLHYVEKFPPDFISVFLDGIHKDDNVRARVRRIAGYRELLHKANNKEIV